MSFFGPVRTSNAWGVELDPRRSEEVRFAELITFALLSFRTIEVPGTGLPATGMASALFIILVLFRRPDANVRLPPWFMALLGGLVVWFFITGLINGVDGTKRIGSVGTDVALALTIASGRVHARSAGIGLAIGLVLSTASAIIELPQSTYQGRLTGFLGDPNGAGLILSGLGLCAIALLERRSHRVLVLVVVVVGVTLTFSRTTYLALAVALLWVAVGKRVSLPLAVPILAAVVLAVESIPASLVRNDYFGNREGSDALRERIVAVEEQAVAARPWTGNGPGTAVVNLGDQEFFFHSSFLAIRGEGGWIAFGLYVAVVLLTFMAAASVPLARRNGWYEAAILAGLLCALNIGEALLTAYLLVPIGLAMRHALANDSTFLSDESDPSMGAYGSLIRSRDP